MREAEWVRHPDPGRPVLSLSEAARILSHRLVTVQNQISSGRLAGGKYPGKARWWVYADAEPRLREFAERQGLIAPATIGDEDLRRQLEEVTRRRDELEADLRDAQNRANILLATTAVVISAGEKYEAAAEEYKALAERSLSAAEGYRGAADGWRTAVGMWRDLMAQENVPPDASGLDGLI